MIVTVAGRSIGLFNIDGRFYALRNRCPHMGADLCAGRIQHAVDSEGPGDFGLLDDVYVLRCPWHGWEFNLETGESWFDPEGTRVRRYDVGIVSDAGAFVADGRAVTAGGDLVPPAAETYPVSVDDEYLAVDLPSR
jgi:3-phenylpropionate/trans-cinnamate dioxygenase ferredoxin subunit